MYKRRLFIARLFSAMRGIPREQAEEIMEGASRWEEFVRDKLLQGLENTDRIEFGPGAGIPEIFLKSPYDPEHPYDLELFSGSKLVAYIDVQHSPTYTYESSKFFLIQQYKIQATPKISAPIFFVQALPLEKPEQLIYWINKRNVDLGDLRENMRTKVGGQIIYQNNYVTQKNTWIRGLPTLIEELQRITGQSTARVPFKA